MTVIESRLMQNIYQEAARYRARVKEGGDTPHIALEPYDQNIAFLKQNNAYLFLDLAPGTTLEKAQEIADYLNRNIMHLGCFRLG